MTPNLGLMLGTIERALAASILPGAANASAKEEASLAILFVGWLREVLDDVPAAERTSYRECRAALDDVRSRIESGGAADELLREASLAPLDLEAAPAAEIRQATAKIKALLGHVLRALRKAGNVAAANEVRARLFDLALGEIDRERAFGRGSKMDPEWTSIPALAEVVSRSMQDKEMKR